MFKHYLSIAILMAGAGFVGCAFSAGLVPAEIVAAHNRWRAEVGVPPLSYSASLAKSSQAWAEKLKASENCGLRHSGNPANGENLYGAWASGPIALVVKSSEVVDAWGNEKKDYDYTSNSCQPGAMCGHYTQLVWRDTKSVGCGVAACAAGNTKAQVWVCQYSPSGNYVGQKPY